MMFSRRLAARRTLPSLFQHPRSAPFLRPGLAQVRRYAEARPEFSTDGDATLSAAQDPGMNGGYVNPPLQKRQLRDPYEKYWDPQEKRNYGEPVHEDEDILGVFTPHVYTHMSKTPGKAFFQLFCFIGAVFGLCGVVYVTYPDKPAAPRTWGDNGLERALGGKGTKLAPSDVDE